MFSSEFCKKFSATPVLKNICNSMFSSILQHLFQDNGRRWKKWKYWVRNWFNKLAYWIIWKRKYVCLIGSWASTRKIVGTWLYFGWTLNLFTYCSTGIITCFKINCFSYFLINQSLCTVLLRAQDIKIICYKICNNMIQNMFLFICDNIYYSHKIHPHLKLLKKMNT